MAVLFISRDGVGLLERGGHTTSTSKQLVQDNFDRVECIKGLRLGAAGDARVIVTLAEPPQTDLVEVVKAD
jgi:hypothetical protein